MTHGHRHPKSQGTNFMEKTTGLAYKIKEKNKELRITRKKKKKTCGLSLRTLVKEYLLSPKQQINEPTRVKLYS
jgi:hypothetical protein